MKSKYTKELLSPIVERCSSVAAVLRALNVRQSGGMQSHIKRVLISLDIDISHFVGQGWNTGINHIGGYKKRAFSEVLILEEFLGKRCKSNVLRRALLESGVEYLCEICSISNWNGIALVLEIDHKNGKNWDNRKENLRFLCPNCHSQTENYSNKNRRPCDEMANMAVSKTAAY